jgi:hypothetical protein
VDAVEKYLSNSSVNAPFFLVVGDENYTNIKAALLEKGLKAVSVSHWCGNPDKRPNLDNLISTFDFADIDSQSQDKKIVVLGLGEYLALCGKDIAFTWLSKIKDMKVGNARVVLLLRGVSEIILKLQSADPTRFDIRRVLFTESTETNINVVFVPANLNLPAEDGIQALIVKLENGCVSLSAKSNIVFDNSLLATSRINSAYNGIKHFYPIFPLDEACGDENQWTEFLADLIKANGDIGVVVNEFGSNPENNLTHWIKGNSYKNWLFFVDLKLRVAEIENSYLRYVLEITTSFTDFKRNILDAIISIPHIDNRFDKFYGERRTLVDKLTESDVAAFIVENKINLFESVYKLTDQTLVERKEFVVLFSNIDKQTVLQRTKSAYIALNDYLWKYTFNDPKVGDELNTLFTNYFDRYKWQKVLNAIDEDFLLKVEELAKKRIFTRLRSRNEVINTIDKTGTFLYWVDALGVEFLGFIQQQCEHKGISLCIHIAQADLPTITTINKGFFTDWTGQKEKDERLDSLKHKESGGYDYQHEKLPLHLAEELDVLGKILEKAATMLAIHQCKRVLIVSDHGASRLAIIKEQEEKYETDTKGEHSGRCCKIPPNCSPTEYDLPFATEGNGYLVLADYGRFKGSRAANVEVHGGASLEEVVIPIIELTLANPDIKVELVDGDNIFASFRKKAEFVLFCKSELGNVSVIIKDKRYTAVKTDKNHHHIFTEIIKAGEYPADVFDGDNLVDKINLIVKSETRKNSGAEADFDSMF